MLFEECVLNNNATQEENNKFTTDKNGSVTNFNVEDLWIKWRWFLWPHPISQAISRLDFNAIIICLPFRTSSDLWSRWVQPLNVHVVIDFQDSNDVNHLHNRIVTILYCSHEVRYNVMYTPGIQHFKVHEEWMGFSSFIQSRWLTMPYDCHTTANQVLNHHGHHIA